MHEFSSAAALYGKGVFTTISIHERKPLLWEKHWRRLSANAVKLGVDLSEHSEEATRHELEKAVSFNGLDNGRARLTFFDETPSSVWTSGGEKQTALRITTGNFRPLPEIFKLTVSPHHINTTSPLAGVKSCNYLENLMAFDEAKSRGFDEAIRLNERGEIASACMANVFWLKSGKLFTPGLKTGCLAGTTREFVLENIDCEEVEAGIDELKNADQMFLTSAGIGIIAVAEFDGRSLASDPHPIIKLWPR